MPLPSNLNDWLKPFVTVITRATPEHTGLPEMEYEKVVLETDQVPNPVTVAMTARELQSWKALRQRHVIIVSLAFLTSAHDA